MDYDEYSPRFGEMSAAIQKIMDSAGCGSKQRTSRIREKETDIMRLQKM